MDEWATGLVLRTYPLTESSLIVHWLTREQGRIATVAKGARRARSTFRGKVDLFFSAEFLFVRSRRSELHTLKELRVIDTHPRLRQDLSWLRRAAYGAALIEQATEADSPLPEVFELFSDFLDAIPAASSLVPVLTFEVKLLDLLGLAPDVKAEELSAGARRVIGEFKQANWEKLARLRLSDAQRRELSRFLGKFMTWHLGKIPRGRGDALE